MVGVPGRSRACQTCRERRVKCGLQKPICSQCAKKKRPCGYERNHVFVHNEQGTHKTVYRKTDGSLAQSLPKDYKSEANGNGNNEWVTSPDDAIDIVTSTLEPLQLWKAPNMIYSLQQALVATAIEDGKKSKAFTLNGILSRSLAIDASGYLYSAPLACYAAWRGRQDNDPNLINASHRFYVQALRETQRALNHPITARDDATLAACNALGLFEAIECPDRNIAGFRWHRDACCRLIELRGPEAHQEGIAHVLFISMRSFGFLEALESVRPTFFGEPEWMSVPFLHEGKTSNDKLVDILSHGPALLRKAFQLEEDVQRDPAQQQLDGRQRLALVLDIARDLSTIVSELDSFYEDLKSVNAEPLYWHSDEYEEESELNFPPSLHFQDLGVASALSLYSTLTEVGALSSLVWASLGDCSSGCDEVGAGHLFLHVFNTRQTELSSTPGFLNKYANISTVEIRRRCVDASRKVCQTTAYCTTTEALESGPPRGSIALSIVIDTVRKRTDADLEHVYLWATKARRAIGEKWVKLLKYQA